MILTFGTTPAVQRVMEFERVTLDAVNRATRVTQLTAGKAMNAARVARQLEAEATAVSFLGGATGRLVRDDLTRSGVGLSIVAVRAATRTCVTVVDRSAHTTTELVEESPAVNPGDCTKLLAALDARLPHAKVLICSGTLAPGAPQDLYAVAVRTAAAAGVMTIVDAKARPLHAALDARPTVVKPNLSELAATVGRTIDSERSLREAMGELIVRGATWVVVSRGPDPIVVGNAQSTWTIAVPPVTPVNPIGSGDALAAGIAVALARGTPLPDAALLGAACGAANALTPFAGVVDLADVERIRPTLTLRPDPASP